MELTGNGITLRRDNGRGVTFKVIEPAAVKLERSNETLNNRNGKVEALAVDVEGNRAVYRIMPAPPATR